MFVLIRNLNQTKSMSACGGTVRVIRDRFVTPGYRRCRWKLHPRRWGRRVFSYWRRQRKLRRALHKKAERGSVSEILMRQLASLLQERRPFKFFKKRNEKKRKEGPEGNRLSCRVYACVYFFFFFLKCCSLLAVDSDGWNQYCLTINPSTSATPKTLDRHVQQSEREHASAESDSGLSSSVSTDRTRRAVFVWGRYEFKKPPASWRDF